MKITIPLSEILSGGSLKDLYDDLIKIQSGLQISNNGTNVYIQGGLTLNLSKLNQIINAGGEVEEYLMSIQIDKSVLAENIPEGLPNRTAVDGTNRTFNGWFDSTADIYINDADDRIYWLTNPVGNSASEYLTASQIAIVYGLSSYSPNVRSVYQFNSDVSAGGWNKVNF